MSTPASPAPSSDSHDDFALLYVIGFVGKRFLRDEEKVGRAILQALDDLLGKAKDVGARLTAVSSLARGGDVLFAEACAQRGIPWRCLLPFEDEAFLAWDLVDDDDRGPMSVEQQAGRRARAERLRATSFGRPPPPEPGDNGVTAPNVFPDPVVVNRGVVVDDTESRNTAYQDCSYRTVDEADVMICVLEEHEFLEAIEPPVDRSALALSSAFKAGTRATALYAKAAERPCILLNADSEDPWSTHKVSKHFTLGTAWFVEDPFNTDMVREALSCEGEEGDPEPGKWMTPARRRVWKFMLQLRALASHHQKITQSELRLILGLHLLATTLAALCATVLAIEGVPWWLIVLAVLAGAKSYLVFLARSKEERLDDHGHRDQWLHARILSELCRGALATWPLPLQPFGASDEEDFPKVKRLVRTLRLLRAMDTEAGVRGIPRQPTETSLEANMRVACDNYRAERLLAQADYFAKAFPKHDTAEKRWRFRFRASLNCAIAAGLVLAGLLLWEGSLSLRNEPNRSTNDSHSTSEHTLHIKALEALLIIAPFFATYCLGMITILDSRRRATRYGEMHHYLVRLEDTLSHCSSNPSRLRIIKHAERLLIEEQHEWFSATRYANV
jgi:hypothetical protein